MNSPAYQSPPTLFGRLANQEQLDAKVSEAMAAAGHVHHDLEAKTVEATYHGQLLFKAMQKDEGFWLILYNPEFYPRAADGVKP